MLDYELPNTETCKRMTWADKHNGKVVGASIRVNEIYNRISKHSIRSLPGKACYGPGLIFVTTKNNMNARDKMGSRSQKHIGIYMGQHVYHYGNTADKVKKENLNFFIRSFQRNYRSGAPVVFFRTNFLSYEEIF